MSGVASREPEDEYSGFQTPTEEQSEDPPWRTIGSHVTTSEEIAHDGRDCRNGCAAKPPLLERNVPEVFASHDTLLSAKTFTCITDMRKCQGQTRTSPNNVYPPFRYAPRRMRRER